MNRWAFIILCLLILVAAGISWFNASPSSRPFSESQETTEIRAAMDIGSGATNLKIAKIDTKTDKIISQIFEQSIPVPYQKHLEQSSDNTFDREVRTQGIRAIQALKDIAESHKAKKVVAVATAAFRKANNAKEFAQEIEKETGVQVRIIDQDEEGILAFRGALAITPIEADKAVVWDIGGGSMQLTTLTEGGTYLVEKGKTASIPFKNAVIQDIEKKDIQTISSPNPMSEQTIQQAAQYAEQLAQQTDPYVKEKLQQPSTVVFAVGSLFNYGIRPLVNDPKKMTRSQLEQAINQFTNKPDQALPGGALAEVAVTNPVLVLGYMKGLNIKQLEILSVNNADGALTYPAYWDEQ